MRHLRFQRCRWLAGSLVAGSVLACAEPASAATWVCGLSEDGTRLVCAADSEPTSGDAAPAAPATAVVNGTSFPLDPARIYTVPLWTPPTEAAFVFQLAHATMCFRTASCSVVLAPSPWLGTLAAVRSRR
jgi:hypothetical protein